MLTTRSGRAKEGKNTSITRLYFLKEIHRSPEKVGKGFRSRLSEQRKDYECVLDSYISVKNRPSEYK